MSSRLSIMIIDDDPVFLDSMVELLSKEYEVEACETANEALEVRKELLRQGRSIEFYITDQVMPNMQGIELLKLIKSDPMEKAPCVLLTAYADMNVAIEGINTKSIDYFLEKQKIAQNPQRLFDAIDKLSKVRKDEIAAEMAKKSRTLVPLDTAWFDNRMEEYFNDERFRNLSKALGFDLRELVSQDLEKIATAQQKIVQQSKIFNEIQGEHAGFMMPLLYYTHDLRFAQDIPHHNPEFDKIVLTFDQGDSLRRRHIALSYSILPKQIVELSEDFEQPITIKNFGSGIGLDAINAVKLTRVNVDRIINIDINPEALRMGRNLVDYLEGTHNIEKNKVVYTNNSFLSSLQKNNKAHLAVAVGIYCGLTDYAAGTILKKIYQNMYDGGRIVTTCGNQNMRDQNPEANFLIQHIGTRKDPTNGWGLNFRTKDDLYNLLDKIGFKNIEIYDDATYPGKSTLENSVLYGVDPLPALALGMEPLNGPIALPPIEILKMNIGYNWIAIAKK